MEVVIIEKKTFDAMLERFHRMTARIEALHDKGKDKALSQWLDNQQVCQILQISPRSLQSYRDNGTIGYTQIGHKLFYRPEDVEQAIAKIASRKV